MGGGAASGKVGAHVAAHNSGGQYLRARTTPTNPNTVFQQAVRNAVRTLTTRWSSVLTQDQRDSWDVYGRNVTVRNRLGDQIKISGIAHYTRSNTPRLQAALAVVDDGPPLFDLGDVTPGVFGYTLGAATGTLTLDTSADWIANATGSENSLLLYVSRPQNIGISFFKGPYQFAGQVNSAQASTGTFTFTLPFAYTVTPQQQSFAQVRVTRGDGRLSSGFQLNGGT
jgi:hypothetical protein